MFENLEIKTQFPHGQEDATKAKAESKMVNLLLVY